MNQMVTQLSLNFLYFISTIFFSLFLAIALIRLILSSVYAKGNVNDELLTNLMQNQGISTWKQLKQVSGTSSEAIWMLRDGNIDSLRWGELKQISTALSLPLPNLLSKLGLLESNPN